MSSQPLLNMDDTNNEQIHIRVNRLLKLREHACGIISIGILLQVSILFIIFYNINNFTTYLVPQLFLIMRFLINSITMSIKIYINNQIRQYGIQSDNINNSIKFYSNMRISYITWNIAIFIIGVNNFYNDIGNIVILILMFDIIYLLLFTGSWSRSFRYRYARTLLIISNNTDIVNSEYSDEKFNEMTSCKYIDINTDNEKCMICLEEFSDGDELKHLICNHKFHIECIKNWFKQEFKCPLCRHNFGEIIEEV